MNFPVIKNWKYFVGGAVLTMIGNYLYKEKELRNIEEEKESEESN